VVETLAADVAEALDDVEGGLPAAAAVLRRHLAVDRVSISRVDPSGGTFEILATAGAGLLHSGTRLAVGTSSHFLAAAEHRTFVAPRFSRDRDFARPLDEVVLAAGFGSGCAVPLTRPDAAVVGALALTGTAEGVDYAAELARIEPVRAMLARALDHQRPPLGPLIILCHEDPLVGHGLARVAETSVHARTRVCTSLADAQRAIATAPPDLIVCDDHVGGVRVDRFAGLLGRAAPSAPLLVVATHDTPENRGAAARAGVASYVARAGAVHSLPIAISTLCEGRALLAPKDSGAADGEPLTDREQEILARLDEGLRMKQMAFALGISEATAKTHARNVFRKLGVTSRAEAVREARRQGLLR